MSPLFARLGVTVASTCGVDQSASARDHAARTEGTASMDDLRQPISTPTIACPTCGTALALAIGHADTSCSCGFSGSTVYLQEADYLRRGIPAWTQRLADLDRMIAAGQRPPAGEYAPVHHGPAAYQIILAVGGFLIVAGIAAFSVIIESAWAIPIQLGLVAATGYATVKLRTRMSATASALALAAAGAWWFFLFWLSMAFSDGDWWRPDGWFPTSALAATALVLLTAARASKVAVWTYLGLVSAAMTPVVGSIWAVTTVNNATTINHGLSNALVAIPLSVIGILALQRRIRFFPQGHIGQILIAGIGLGATIVYALASVQFAPAWSACVAWSAHLAVGSALLASHPGTRIAAGFVTPFAAAAAAGFTFLTLWGSVALLVVALVAMTAYRTRRGSNRFAAGIAYLAWLIVANIGWADITEDQRTWMTVIASAATACVLVYTTIADRVAWLTIPAWPIALVAIGSSVDLAGGEALEQHTLPFAVATLGLGLVARSIRRELPSVLWLGPAALVGLLPSSFASLGTSPGTRFWLVLAATVLMLVIGTLMNYGGLLLTGTVCSVIVAFQPLSDPQSSIPKWVSFAAAGAVLVLVGARFEVLRASIAGDKGREAVALR